MKNQQKREEFRQWQGEDCCSPSGYDTPKTEKESPRRPNMIWIVTDQQRASSLACNGDPNVNTPNLDMMARFGINFQQAVSSYPICCPFRGTMLTGLRHSQCVPGHCYQMPPEQTTIADIFNQNGYDTAFFGKWHVDGCRRNSLMHIVPPERRGRFNRWIGYENNDSQWNTWIHGHDANHQEIPQHQLKGYETDGLTDLLLDYIDERSQNPDQPFFAVLSVFPPHEPYVAPAEQLRHYKWNDIILRDNVPADPAFQENAKRQLARYYAMVENIDTNVGRVLQTLRDHDMELDTHIMFFSDHGDMMGSHGMYGKVVPHEESLRIPFIISGAVSHHYQYYSGNSDALITDLDIVPTTLGLCGIPVPPALEGYDYSYIRYGSPQERQQRSLQEPQYTFAESIMPRECCDKAWRAVITRDGWKYATFENEEWLLFDLNSDPYEQHNLAHANYMADKRRELNAVLKAHLEEVGDSFELPDSRFFG